MFVLWVKSDVPDVYRLKRRWRKAPECLSGLVVQDFFCYIFVVPSVIFSFFCINREIIWMKFCIIANKTFPNSLLKMFFCFFLLGVYLIILVRYVKVDLVRVLCKSKGRCGAIGLDKF